MKRFSFIMALPLLVLAGCSGDKEPADNGKGSVVLDCSVAGAVGAVTRAETRNLPAGSVPAAGNLKLKVSNAGGAVKSYASVSDYDAPLLVNGAYTFEFSYGDPAAEGPGAAYFYLSQPITVVSRKEITQPVTVPLANSVYSLSLTEWFMNYYTEYSITITTESGYAQTYTGSESEPLEETGPVFVKAGTKLYLQGTATKTNGVEVAFQNTQIGGTTAACTWYTIEVDISTIGDAAITVRLDDTLTVVPEEIELNPDAE